MSIKSMAKETVMRAVSNKGYKTSQRIVLFESDDWGSIRTPSREAILEYKRKNRGCQLNHYQLFDSLEKGEDLHLLAEVLRSFHNKQGESPIFTLNFAMANPLFSEGNEKLGAPFRFEPITQTYKRMNGAELTPVQMLNLEACTSVMRPQLHGREHLNVTSWRRGILHDKRLKDAYKLEIIGLDSGKYSSLDALNQNNTDINRESYLIEAQQLFEGCFGYKSRSFIPPCYVVDSRNEKCLSSIGVQVLQSGLTLNRPIGFGMLARIPTPMGSITSAGQVRLVRNVQFEPSRWLYAGMTAEEIVTRSLAEIKHCFEIGQPAVICTHRVNYVSRISTANRDMSLNCLQRLLSHIVKHYPDVLFLSSDELGDYISNGDLNERQHRPA